MTIKSFPCPNGDGICSYDPQSRGLAIVVVDGQPSVIPSGVAARLIDDSPSAAELSQLLTPVALPKGLSHSDLIDLVRRSEPRSSETVSNGPYATQDVASLLPKNDGIIVTCSCNHQYTLAI